MTIQSCSQCSYAAGPKKLRRHILRVHTKGVHRKPHDRPVYKKETHRASNKTRPPTRSEPAVRATVSATVRAQLLSHARQVFEGLKQSEALVRGVAGLIDKGVTEADVREAIERVWSIQARPQRKVIFRPWRTAP